MADYPDYMVRTCALYGKSDVEIHRERMIRGEEITYHADYAHELRKKGQGQLALLIERHHGEQRNLKFFDFFPAQGRLYRIDDRTTEPLEGWQLDQDRRMKDDVRHYDEWGVWHDHQGPVDLGRVRH